MRKGGKIGSHSVVGNLVQNRSKHLRAGKKWWRRLSSLRAEAEPCTTLEFKSACSDSAHTVRTEGLWIDSQLAWVQGNLLTAQTAGVAEPANLPGVYPTSQHDQSARVASPSQVGNWGKPRDEGQLNDAVEALHVLVGQGSYVPDAAFYRLLKGCILEKNLVVGRRVHALTLDSGYECTTFLANHFIRMYASNGRLQDAMQVFAKLATPNAFSWFYVISAHVDHGQPVKAIRLYQEMRRSSVEPNNHVFVKALKACASMADLESGKQVHTDVLGSGLEPDTFVGNSLVDMYAKCGSLEDARQVFESLETKSVVTWTSMIAGYAQHGHCQEALSLYVSMQKDCMTSANHVTYASLLKACASTGALREGKELHSQVVKHGLEAEVVIGSSLVDMYVKCGSIKDARRVFDNLPSKDVVTWTVMIGGYACCGLAQEALTLYSNMKEEGVTMPNGYTFVPLLKACGASGALHQGEQLHLEIQERGLDGDVVIGRSLVDMYSKCGRMEAARGIFDRLPSNDVVTWTTMIAGYAQQGLGQEALSLYTSMQQEAMLPANQVTYSCLLNACASIRALGEGKKLHCEIQDKGLVIDEILGNSLIDMYAKCGSMEDAHMVFDKLPTKNVATWNALISGYSQNGCGVEALSLFKSLQKDATVAVNHVTYACVLKACANTGLLNEGKELHLQIKERGLEADPIITCGLVDMYANCGSIEDARSVFDKQGIKGVEMWGAMIASYVHCGLGQEALTLYACMQESGLTEVTESTLVCLLKACASIRCLRQGKELHAQIRKQGLEHDVVLCTSLVDMYAKCRSLADARYVFDSLPKRDVVTWNAMITGYCQHGLNEEALSLYASMHQEGVALASHVTFACLLKACASIGALHEGKNLHSQIQDRGLESNLLVGNGLVDMYAKCCSLVDAQRVFDRLPTKDVVTWNAMITGYAQHGLGQEALHLYELMQQEGMTPDHVTFVCLLKACASIGALGYGRELHSEIKRQGLETEVAVGSSLVDMYAKCGYLDDARRLFDRLPTRDVVTWNSLLYGYSQHDDSQMAIQCFQEMRQEGVEPNEATFLCLLVACSHQSLVSHAQQFFKSMVEDHGIAPGALHYTSMVDVLGRAGRMDEAENMLLSMPFEKDVVGWTSLLTSCASHNDVDRAQRCFDHLTELEPQNAGAYVLLANLYANTGRWVDVERIESLRRSAGAWKKPARAWIELDRKVQDFTVGEERDDISSKLRSSNLLLKEEGGHVPHTELVLKPVSEREKEDALCGHAEKLALAYGLLNTPDGATLLVTKNLRMCNDCHSGTKIMSRVEKREIIVRDAHRVHHFVDGWCSCDRHK